MAHTLVGHLRSCHLRTGEAWLKPSSAKKTRILGVCPINLNHNVLELEDGTPAISCVTVGAPAAHPLGFATGGALRLKNELQQLRDLKEGHVTTGAEAGGDLELGAKIDIVSLDLTARLHYCLPQSVTAATTALVALLHDNMKMDPAIAKRTLSRYRELGVVIQVPFVFDALLSSSFKIIPAMTPQMWPTDHLAPECGWKRDRYD